MLEILEPWDTYTLGMGPAQEMKMYVSGLRVGGAEPSKPFVIRYGIRKFDIFPAILSVFLWFNISLLLSHFSS